MATAPLTPQLVGAAIRSRRQAASLTLSELAHRAGVNSATLWRIENGQTMPTVMTLHRIAETLGVDMAELTQA